MKVNIYALIDPLTLKVRYIGRTRCELGKRLAEHISKSKHDYNNTHKSNWIKSLLKINSKPYIRLLTVVDGWEESHQFERDLISKYESRLLNHDDKGTGSKNHIVGPEYRQKISETLKRRYAANEIKRPSDKPTHVYDLEGNYLTSFENGRQAANSLNIAYSAIYKCISGFCKAHSGYQFSREKVDKMHKIVRGKMGKYIIQ